MEKELKESSSGETAGENTENQDVEHIADIPIDLIAARRQELFEEMRNLQLSIRNNIREMKDIKKTLAICDETFSLPPPEVIPDVSSTSSPIHDPQVLFEDSLVRMSYPQIPREILNQPVVIYDPNEPLPQTSTYDEAGPLRTDAKFKEPQSFVGKGKAAANPKYRYKKRSKPEVSSNKASSQETPDKPSKEASGATEIKTMGSQTSEADNTISPAVKRKVSDSDESCSTAISKLSGACKDDNDDRKIAKKLKLHDDEKTSIQCSTTTTLVSQKKCEQSDPSEYIDQSHADQSRSESEQSSSSNGAKKVVSDESSILKVNDYFPCSESSLSSGSNDATPSDSRESTSTSISIDVPLGERPESRVKSSSDFAEIFPNTSDEASLPITDGASLPITDEASLPIADEASLPNTDESEMSNEAYMESSA